MLANQLHAAGVPVFPCLANKAPAVKGWQKPLPPEQYNWPSGLVGVPVPQGVTIIDLDTYKGVTRERVEQVLGCALPWDQALIQTTLNGGQHYAFAVSWDVIQGSDIKDASGNDIPGLDTRVTGRGFIATGQGYTHVGAGPFILAHPGALPKLPEASRRILERVAQAPAERIELPTGDRDLATLREALTHIDPGCSRSDWLRIGLALRHYFHDMPEQGLSLFDDWSSGCLWKDGEPANYDADSIDFQWGSFKPEGGVTVASLFYSAMQSGWQPPATFDTSLAFGQGAAPVDAFADMIDRITAEGSNAKLIDGLIQAIGNMSCSPIQRDLLVTSLKYEMREAKLLDKKLGDKLDRQLRPEMPNVAQPQVALPDVMPLRGLPPQQLGKPTAVHGTNALSMMNEIFRGRIAVMSGFLRWWSGQEWEPADEDDLETLTFNALMPDQAKKPNVSGTIAAIRALCPKLDEPQRDRRVYFKNCVLDATTGQTTAHHRDNLNTGTLQTDFTPGSTCPNWHNFIASLWGDQEDGADRTALLQEIVGWCMIRDDLNMQKIIAFDGASRAGKGVVFEVMQGLLGENTSGTMTFSNIADGKTQSSFRAYDVMFDYEAKPPERQMMKQAIGFMNKLASNERVSIQLLNKQTPWTGRLYCKALIACNGVPTMLDDSGASVSRFQPLKFTRSFEGREDRTLVPRLKQELPGIALWALDGLTRLIANDGRFTQPLTSQQARADLSESNQPLRDFIAERMTFENSSRSHKSDIWAAYRLYAQEANVKLPTRSIFYHSLDQTLLGSSAERRPSVRINDKVAAGYTGIRLADHALPFAPLQAVK